MLRQYLVLGAILSCRAYARTSFDWNSIQPSRNLSWVGCYSGVECARFSVPLNYSDPSQGNAAIAMIRIKSNFTGADYLGPLFFNPGGPGDSGVAELNLPSAVALASTNPQFDLVSFDPRGVAHSTPPISFFTSDAEKALWLSAQIADSNSSSEALARQVAQARLTRQIAKDRDNGFLAHVTTDNVARDMLEMVEAYGGQNLHYWGVSAGTILGATFASMFPDRVGGMILDGVVDSIGYYESAGLIDISDADQEIQHLVDACYNAGPSKCALHNNASSPDEIASNLNDLVVDYDYLHGVMLSTLYTPYTLFAPVASALEELRAGNATGMFGVFPLPFTNSELCSANSDDGDGSSSFSIDNSREAEIAIQCSDWGVVEHSLDDLQALLTSGNSSFFGESMLYKVECIGWQIHPQHFTGPIGANTRFPLMFIGNTADPVTPLANAHKISQVFPGSVVLQQNSLGHTSRRASSECTRETIRSYFSNGTLPQPGKVCDVESELFVGSGIHV